MVSFGAENKEFGNMPPFLVSFEEVFDEEEGTASNSLKIIISSNYTEDTYQILFPSYTMHLTRNESYTVWDDYENRTGNYLIVFTKSRFIDFYDDVIIHTEDDSWPGKGTHYGIYTCGHIIDILSTSEPIISKI